MSNHLAMKTKLTVADLTATVPSWQIAILVGLVLISCRAYYLSNTRLNVPAVGVPPGLFGSWRAAFSWMSHSEVWMREGLRRYGKTGQPFKVSTLSRWILIVTNPDIVNEVKDSERDLSFSAAISERLSMSHTLTDDLHARPYHLDIIAKKLTHKLTSVLPVVVEEITLAFEENTNIGTDWTSLNHYEVMLKCVSRTTNKIFVGLPLCRNQDYLDSVVGYARKASMSGQTINNFPWFLKPIVAKFVLNRDEALGKVLKYVGPMFIDRMAKMRELGDEWTNRPDDAVQWVLDAAPPDSSLEDLCMRILFLNWASIHTSSFTITHALLDLAAHPEYQEPLKDEIESTLNRFGGWQKQALTNMKKLDSVLRESLRVSGVNVGTVLKKATVSHSLSDGTYLPKGTWVMAPASAIHHSDDSYDNAMTFDGFRFSQMREQLGSEAKHQAISTTDDYLAFGHGRHACPGRFFAANELKILLAYIVCNYEVKSVDGKRPGNGYHGFTVIPAVSTELLFRERPGRLESPVNIYNH